MLARYYKQSGVSVFFSQQDKQIQIMQIAIHYHTGEVLAGTKRTFIPKQTGNT